MTVSTLTANKAARYNVFLIKNSKPDNKKNKNVYDRNQQIFMLVMVLFFFFILIAGGLYYKGEKLGFFENQIYEFDKGWTYVDDAGNEIAVLPPDKIPANKKEEYSISAYLPADFKEGMSILVRTSQQSIRASVADEVIYERGWDSSLYVGEFRGSAWNIFLIPKKYAGEKLTLTFLSPYETFAGSINAISYGYKSDLMYKIVREQSGQLFAAVIMMGICLGMLFFYLIKLRERVNGAQILYLSMFAMFSSLYLFGESRLLQFFFQNQFFITSLAFLAEIMIPIPILLYLREQWMPRHRWVARTFQWFVTLVLLITIVMQFTGVGDFFETITLFHILVESLLVAIIVVTSIEIIKYRYIKIYPLANALGILIIGTIFGIIQINVSNFFYVGFCLQMGMLGFEIVMAIDAIRKYRLKEEEVREKKYYKRLAFIDGLTHGQNRNAYMEKMLELSNKQEDIQKTSIKRMQDRNLYYVIMDLNNLKRINDTYGHTTGDDAILRAHKCITSAFARWGDCYRIGGDEFVVLAEQCTSKDIELALCQLQLEFEQHNREIEYELSIAVGYAGCSYADEIEFDKLMKEADKMLYENKHIMKLKDLIIGYNT